MDEDGSPVTAEETRRRIEELAIPPAWTEVWICPDPRGHLQATGSDAAGRKQYLYHERWREQRDRAKFRRMIGFARALPRLRRKVTDDLKDEDLSRDRVLAAAVRLLDVGLFRIGGEEYANQGGGLGLATLRPEHITIDGDAMVFDYPSKSGIRRVHEVADRETLPVVTALKRRRGGPDELRAHRANRRWIALRSDDVNGYIKLGTGDEYSAKDFRTWNATVLAATVLVTNGQEARTKTARRRLVKTAVCDVAELLGNTPAVARRAYIDPRVFDRYLSGWTLKLPARNLGEFEALSERRRRSLELAVIHLLDD